VSAFFDALIWIGSVAAGVSVLIGIALWFSRRTESRQAKALLGPWYGYGFFDGREGPLFYRESVVIKRGWLPWRFEATATPISNDATNPYTGSLRVRAPMIYCSMREEVYEDRTFGIGRIIMDERHAANTIIWLALGRSYEETIHTACALVWSRRSLDPSASQTVLPNPETERAAFLQLVRRYFTVDGDTFQLNMR
jgi:hypothetical protein